MNSLINFNLLLYLNLLLLACLCIYLTRKISRHSSARYLLASLLPLIALQIGSYLFFNQPGSLAGGRLILFATAIFSVTLVPVSLVVGRTQTADRKRLWTLYHAIQIVLLIVVAYEIFFGRFIEWVTGILEQPIIIVASQWRYYFVAVIGAGALALLCFDKTLQQANKTQQDEIKFLVLAYLGFTIFFCYLAVNILVASYLSLWILQLGSAIVCSGLLLLAYGFAKYPPWEVSIRISRRVVFGSLSASAVIVYLVISGTILDALRSIEDPQGFGSLVPFVAFVFVILFLFLYLSPKLQNRAKALLTKNFFRNKYDYRDLWTRFSDKSSGSLNLGEVLPRVGEFVAEAMFVRQVAIWLRAPNSNAFRLAYRHDRTFLKETSESTLRCDPSRLSAFACPSLRVPSIDSVSSNPFPMSDVERLRELGIDRIVFVGKDDEIVALLGIGPAPDESSSAEDEQFLASVSNQLGHLILMHKISEELLLAREWDSFNRFASFILHDLKNLATLQGMTLENAKHFGDNPAFIKDAFSNFEQTTEKMINLIASLSVQRGQFSLKQQPVDILEVISGTFDHLKIAQRNGLEIRTTFPPRSQLRPVAGDPDLLQKAFTNLLLNAIQSLPQGTGEVEVTVSNHAAGKITTSIRDTGCGIAPERLDNLFRPFQTTKEKGLGIGLCHTRSIIEVHGGQIRIESQVNTGTKVEVELPTL